MSSIPLPVYSAVLFFLGGVLLLHLHRSRQNRQYELPDCAAYLASHGMAEPVCHRCNGTMLGESGLRHDRDPERLMRCLHCETMLYRFHRSDIPDEDADWAPLKR